MADFLETYSGFFLAESAGGTLADFLETYSGFFQRIFLIVLGPLEISAEQIRYRFPENPLECLQRILLEKIRYRFPENPP